MPDKLVFGTCHIRSLEIKEGLTAVKCSKKIHIVYEFFGFPCQYHSTVAIHAHISSGE
jgi:hypothetical protein